MNNPLTNDELDRRLALARGPETAPRIRDELRGLGRAARTEAAASGAIPTRNPRRTWVGGLALAGAAVVLTAGTTATAYYLQIPPFVGLNDGDIRTSESIPLRYETDNGVDIACRIFIDFSHAERDQVHEVDEAIRSTDWSHFGQDLYDAQPNLPDAPTLSESLNPQEPVKDAADSAVVGFASGVVPGLLILGEEGDGPRLSSLIMTCVPSAQ